MLNKPSPHRPIVTRFAPSPTGFLHIGGARTALFNWLFARHCDGRYLLRIEDTDRARSTAPAIAAIQNGLDWLGLPPDEPAVFQFGRAERHREVVEELLRSGHAYRCYCSPDELQEMRKLAESEGRPPVYDRRWRDRDPSDAPSGVEPAIRLKTPLDGETIVADRVQGVTTFQNAVLDDLIILRSNGTPTYNLAVVVDDHDMGITHVIRGVDHLNNAARQSGIYHALGWDVPVFAHVPLIHGTDGSKLSKRHGALGVEAYRDMGYLPVALRNYLVRLGWSHGDQEIFSTHEMIAAFDLDGLGRSPARFDFDKLADINAHYLRQSEPDALLAEIKGFLPHLEGGSQMLQQFETVGSRKLAVALPSLQDRAQTLVDVIDGAKYLIAKRPIELNDQARKILNNDAKKLLTELAAQLTTLEPWTVGTIESEVRKFLAAKQIKLGKVGPAVRAALTGTTAAPPIFDMMAALGQDESIARLQEQSA
ncbi:MAG: glutamate--tRNA ligase [Hyphomicrobiaceae bacterium]